MDSRTKFRDAVFARDSNTCIVPGCDKPAQDAHHIIERALWTDPSQLGGYLIDNGASLCSIHHKHVERNFFPPQTCRDWAGIGSRVLPTGWDSSQWYDKWGKGLTHPTRQVCKYPSTMYLNFSPGMDKLDVIKRGLLNTAVLLDKPLLFTVKMDGSNCSLTDERVAARNGENAFHPSFDLIKRMHAAIKHNLNFQIFGEWCYAKHSIEYLNLDYYFQAFAGYDVSRELWISWSELKDIVIEISKNMGQSPRETGIGMVPVLDEYNNMIDFMDANVSDVVRTFETEWELTNAIIDAGNAIIAQGHEGLVIKSAYPFHYAQMDANVAKYVRKDHVQTEDKHWSKQPIIKNGLNL